MEAMNDRIDWVRLTFAWHGTILPRIALRLLGIAAVGAALQLAIQAGLAVPRLDPLGHTLLGVSLGLLIVFRTNSSYDRYWEGRKAWGTVVNASRNLARLTAAHTPTAAPQCATLLAAYAVALKARLRRVDATPELRPLLPEEWFARGAPPEQHTEALTHDLNQVIYGELSAGRVNAQTAPNMERLVADLVDQQGTCERILNTPIPFGHAAHINQLLMAYLLTLPLVLVPPQGWLGVGMATVIAFGLLGIEGVGAEIEDPFGTDVNDLPLDDLCRTIERDCRYLAGGG
jgi:putative membrane protein